MKNELISDFTAGAPTEFAEIVRRLAEIIEGSGIQFESALRWKQLTYTLNDDFHHWICSINITKKAVDLNFHFGGLLNDPGNLFHKKMSRFLRKLSFKNIHAVDKEMIVDFLNQAVGNLRYFKENWKEIQNRSAPPEEN